jgi:hypothetical protein
MPRGRKKATELNDLPTVITDNEEGTIPYFVLDNEWGVSCDERQEILVRKRIANRTIKDEEGNDDHIEQYFMWDSVSYCNSFTHIIQCYYERASRIEKKKLQKTTNFDDIKNIYIDVNKKISQALSSDGVNKEFMSIASILDDKAKLKEELVSLKEKKEKVEKETDKLLQLIKDKTSIIISRTEPTKHRVKKENGDV